MKIRRLRRQVEDNQGLQQPNQPDLTADMRRKMELEVLLASQNDKSDEDNEWANLAQRDHENGYLTEDGEVYAKAMEVLNAESEEQVGALNDELRALKNHIQHVMLPIKVRFKNSSRPQNVFVMRRDRLPY